MSDSAAGRRVGQYELQEIVGRGGMAVVYRAAQPRIDRDVAIKIIAAPYTHHPAFVSRFEQEMRAIGRLQHPHILPVYDVSLEGDDLYMVMAYLPGGTVSRRIAASADGLPLAEAVCIASQIASALDYAHAQGIIHRDVKPGNVLLDAHGNAYLGDFGIAQVADAENPPPLGTFAYMAPEVLAGARATPASDIYSLGVVAFEMLSGSRPYEAHDRASLLDLRARIGIPNILDLRPDLPPGLQVVLTQALAEDPAGRPPHASSLAAALHRASGLSGLPCAENEESSDGADSGEWPRPDQPRQDQPRPARRARKPSFDDEDDEETIESRGVGDLDDADERPDGRPYKPDERDDLDVFDDMDDADELDDHPLVRTPLPFADENPGPVKPDTDQSGLVDMRMPIQAPPTQVPAPVPAPEPAPVSPARIQVTKPRPSIGPLLLLIWLGVILALLGFAVLAVVLISRAG